MSRPLAALASVALTGLGLLVLLPDCASACSCGPVSTQRQLSSRQPCSPERWWTSRGIRRGRSAVLTRCPFVSPRCGRDRARYLGGNTRSQGSACGYPFEEGQEYLVYAYGKQDLKVDACSETKQLSKADEDLALLGNGEKPKDGGDALTDTSGVVSVRAMVGIAGLAMAASFLVVVRLVRTG